MDELVSIGQKPSENCNVCGVKKKDDCCKTELKIVKTDQPQKSDLLKLSFTNYILEPVQQVFKKVEFSIFKTEITTIQANAPPESASVPIFIQHCQYRI